MSLGFGFMGYKFGTWFWDIGFGFGFLGSRFWVWVSNSSTKPARRNVPMWYDPKRWEMARGIKCMAKHMHVMAKHVHFDTGILHRISN